jgi:hypothetical protein
MRLSVLAAACGIAVLAPPRVQAQSSGNSPSQMEDWALSVGVDPTHFDLRTRDEGVDARFVLNLTRSWKTSSPAVRTHVAFMLGADAPRGFRLDPTGPRYSVSRRYGGLTAGASYEFLRHRRFRPYVSGGSGIYSEGSKTTPRCATEAHACTPGEVTFLSERSTLSLGMNAAFGIRTRLQGWEVYIEQAFHSFDVQHPERGVYPFTIGVRF